MPSKVPRAKTPWAGAGSRTVSDRFYDKSRRDPEATAFYKSPAWRRLREVQITMHPYCQDCLAQKRVSVAQHVAHIKDRREHPELALVLENLVSLCVPCHNARDKRQPDT